MKRLNSPGAVNECMEAMVAGDLVVAAGSGASRADSLLPLYVPGERAQDRRVWLADVLVALLQRAQVRFLLSPLVDCNMSDWHRIHRELPSNTRRSNVESADGLL